MRDWNPVQLDAPDEQVKRQAARCMDCGILFCINGCPLGNIIPDWNDLIYRDKTEEALVFVVAIESTWREFRTGTTDRSEFERVFKLCRNNLESPGGVAWWATNSDIFSRDFRDFYDSQVVAQKAPDSKTSRLGFLKGSATAAGAGLVGRGRPVWSNGGIRC